MNICMISDFYYPNVGGVENHIHYLSQQLIARGHKVVIVTHAYLDKDTPPGVQIKETMVKVYYLNLLVLYAQCTMPNIGVNMPIYR